MMDNYLFVRICKCERQINLENDVGVSELVEVHKIQTQQGIQKTLKKKSKQKSI